MEGGKGKNYRLKRTFLMGKRRGSTTPVPTWKMITPQSHQSPQIYGKDFSLSARKLAALIWEIDGMSSPRVKMSAKKRILESSKFRSMELGLSDPILTTVSEGILDPTKLCSCRRRALMAGCRRLQRANTNLRSSASIPCCLGQVDEKQSHGYGQINGVKSSTSLKDVYNGLAASKQLVNVLSRVSGLEQLECISSTLVSALRAELDQSCDRVSKLIRGEKREKGEIDILLKRIKHSSTRNAVVGELEAEKRLRRRSEKLSKKAGAELAETKASLARAIKEVESEKRARRKVEQVCEELARGVWELKRQFAKVREEVEREQEMFRLADLLREERVQMKLSDAKCLYEEKNALVEKLRNEVEAYLKGERGGGGSSGDEKRKELEKLLRETFTGSQQNRDKESKSNAAVKGDAEDESDDSDLHSIEFSMEEDISRSFVWGDAVENGSKWNSVETSKGRMPKKQARKLQMTLVSECSTN
ncbi:hypothetical protein C2S53_008239 [Perilla frutescens var. hirtella]|uniref:Uncharacterized protein n=1 Tax=Perilla frutescens var. hirtella TaxID=608512 RepID=A0AAD4JMW4_PERFH|nr:hypothetical protein C2S53_008239 [Perilla frutescens var. hirtella]